MSQRPSATPRSHDTLPTQCPVPRTHPPDSPIWISSRPEGSSALFSTNCCPLGLWPYTFRQYNDLIWEPWIKSAYAMQRPFVLGREDDFRHHLDRVHIAETELVEQRAESCAAAIAPSAWTSSRDPFCRYMRWFRLSREEQEHLLLEVLDKISPREQGFYDFRQDAPEVLLADLLADGGQGLVRLAWTCIRSASKPDRPLPPCPAFDRLYGLHSFHSGVPLSAGKQAFDGGSVGGRSEGRTRLPFNNETAPRTLALNPDKAKTQASIDSRPHTHSRHCAACSMPEVDAGSRFLACSNCKDVGRQSLYCSVEHQRDHWPIHKRFCGKAPGTVGAE